MKKALAILLVLIIVFSGMIFNLNQTQGEELLVEVFNQSTFTPIQANINLYGRFEEKISDFQDMKNCMEKINELLNLDCEIQKSEENVEDYMVVKSVYSNKETKISVKLETSQATYLTSDIVVYNDCNKVMELKEQLEKVFKELGVKSNVNISVTGSYKGNLNLEEKKQIANKMMAQMGAKFKEDYSSKEVYSVTGYTKRIEEYINSAGERININLALRYNEYENKTYLYLATPLLVTEY